MSGGSFDYLCYKDDLPSALAALHEFKHMVTELEELGYPDVAEETRKVVVFLENAERELKVLLTPALVQVWHDVEWYCSADYSKSQVERALEKYREVVRETESDPD